MFESVKGFGLTFATMFEKKATVSYPESGAVTKPRYHGRHVLNRHPDGLEKCVGCELCAWACPADAIYVEGGDNTDEQRFSPGERYGRIYQINYSRCIFCGLCIEACPTRSLTMSNEYELASDNRHDLILTKEQLIAPLLPGMEAPPHPMRLGTDEQDYYVGAMANPGASAGAEGVKRDDGSPGGEDRPVNAVELTTRPASPAPKRGPQPGQPADAGPADDDPADGSPADEDPADDRPVRPGARHRAGRRGRRP